MNFFHHIFFVLIRYLPVYQIFILALAAFSYRSSLVAQSTALRPTILKNGRPRMPRLRGFCVSLIFGLNGSLLSFLSVTSVVGQNFTLSFQSCLLYFQYLCMLSDKILLANIIIGYLFFGYKCFPIEKFLE